MTLNDLLAKKEPADKFSKSEYLKSQNIPEDLFDELVRGLKLLDIDYYSVPVAVEILKFVREKSSGSRNISFQELGLMKSYRKNGLVLNLKSAFRRYVESNLAQIDELFSRTVFNYEDQKNILIRELKYYLILDTDLVHAAFNVPYDADSPEKYLGILQASLKDSFSKKYLSFLLNSN